MSSELYDEIRGQMPAHLHVPKRMMFDDDLRYWAQNMAESLAMTDYGHTPPDQLSVFEELAGATFRAAVISISGLAQYIHSRNPKTSQIAAEPTTIVTEPTATGTYPSYPRVKVADHAPFMRPTE